MMISSAVARRLAQPLRRGLSSAAAEPRRLTAPLLAAATLAVGTAALVTTREVCVIGL